MSLGCAGLIGLIVLFKDNAFLGTSAHESVTTAGYSLILVVCRDLKSSENPAVKRGSAVHGRIWAPLGPSWNQFEPTCGQLAAYLSQHVANLVKLGRTWSHNATNLGPENIKNH